VCTNPETSYRQGDTQSKNSTTELSGLLLKGRQVSVYIMGFKLFAVRISEVGRYLIPCPTARRIALFTAVPFRKHVHLSSSSIVQKPWEMSGFRFFIFITLRKSRILGYPRELYHSLEQDHLICNTNFLRYHVTLSADIYSTTSRHPTLFLSIF